MKKLDNLLKIITMVIILMIGFTVKDSVNGNEIDWLQDLWSSLVIVGVILLFGGLLQKAHNK